MSRFVSRRQVRAYPRLPLKGSLDLTYRCGNDYVTSRSARHTLITPAIARLLKRRGAKLVSLYGATADVHDHVTRTPGSFRALERGIDHLRTAGTGFTVQIVPMRANYHQFGEMVRLAGSWSPEWRRGAAWLHLSANGDAARELLPRIVRPLVTADWREDVFSLTGELARSVPFYDLYFDKSGRIVEKLEGLVP